MSRLSVMRLVGLAAVLCLAVVGVSVAIAAGTQHTARYTKGTTATRWVRARTARTAAGAAYAYVQATGHVPAGKFASATLKCPGGNPHAISGYFDSNSTLVFPSTSRPAASNKWIEGLTNAGRSTANVVVGAVCAR